MRHLSASLQNPFFVNDALHKTLCEAYEKRPARDVVVITATNLGIGDIPAGLLAKVESDLVAENCLRFLRQHVPDLPVFALFGDKDIFLCESPTRTLVGIPQAGSLSTHTHPPPPTTPTHPPRPPTRPIHTHTHIPTRSTCGSTGVTSTLFRFVSKVLVQACSSLSSSVLIPSPLPGHNQPSARRTMSGA
jgi:hypothetical protein